MEVRYHSRDWVPGLYRITRANWNRGLWSHQPMAHRVDGHLDWEVQMANPMDRHKKIKVFYAKNKTA